MPILDVLCEVKWYTLFGDRASVSVSHHLGSANKLFVGLCEIRYSMTLEGPCVIFAICIYTVQRDTQCSCTD